MAKSGTTGAKRQPPTSRVKRSGHRKPTSVCIMAAPKGKRTISHRQVVSAVKAVIRARTAADG